MDRTEYYRSIADRYMNLHNTNYAAGYQRNRFNTFNSLLPAGRALRIFDFGCGSGENIVALAREGHAVAGSDLSPEMLDKARRNISAAGLPECDLRLGGVEILAGLSMSQFDVLGALNVLPYLSEAEERTFFSDAREVLKPGGHLIVSHTNALVDIVTFNRYTVEFWREQIIPYITDDAVEREALAREFSAHLTSPDVPAKSASRKSERDVLPKRRINPIVYPAHLKSSYGLTLEGIAFTHYHPMPPQFMESSEKYLGYKLDFEERFRDNPLSYLFASIVLFRLAYS
jgi:2-polyprenyl-3-methyl-5-hydroxy-6-metoxy-1,4-benzoquinol methylase